MITDTWGFDPRTVEALSPCSMKNLQIAASASARRSSYGMSFGSPSFLIAMSKAFLDIAHAFKRGTEAENGRSDDVGDGFDGFDAASNLAR